MIEPVLIYISPENYAIENIFSNQNSQYKKKRMMAVTDKRVLLF